MTLSAKEAKVLKMATSAILPDEISGRFRWYSPIEKSAGFDYMCDGYGRLPVKRRLLSPE